MIWTPADLIRRPATRLLPSILLLPIGVDFSLVSIREARRLSREASGCEPNLIMGSRDDHFEILRALNEYKTEFNELLFWSRYDFRDCLWCVGNFAAPEFFVGSEET